MAVIGTITCFPYAKMALTRAYIPKVGVRAGPAVANWSGRTVDLVDPLSGALYWRTVFYDKFWPWSSNRYTLDFVPEECYYFPVPGGPPTPLNVFVWFETEPVTADAIVVVSPFAGQPNLYPSPTPPAPPGYWYPP